MRITKIYLSVVALLSVVAGCQKPAPLSDPNIELDQKEITFTKDAGSQSVTFISTRDWAVKNLPEWAVAEPERGKASDSKQTVTIKVLENTGKDRTCSITFSCGLVKDYLTVKQAGPGGEDKPGDGTRENPFSATEANEVASKLQSGEETSQAYYVHGFVKKFATKHEEGVKNYGNALFYITNDETLSGDDFYCYQVYYLEGKKFTSLDQIKVGDEVVVYGKLTNYNGTYETVGKGAAYIYSLNGKTSGGDEPGPTPIEPITGTNLLTNGGFETWTGEKPEAWDFTSGNATLTKSSDAKEGSNSCEVSGDPTGQSNLRLMSKQYTLKAGTYQIQAYIKGEGQYRMGYAKLTNGKVADTQNDYIYIDEQPVQAASSWEQHIVQFTVTEQTQISVNVMNSKKGNGKSIIVDDVRLVTNDGGLIEGGDEPAPVVDATVAQVLSEKKTDVIYRLKGTVSKFNSQYCSFDITDATGSIYVYSVISETKSKYKDKLKDGDTVTIEGEYQFYASKNQDEIVNAKIIEWKSAGGEEGGDDDDDPDPSTLTQITCKEFNALPKDDEGWYILEGEVQSITQSTYGNLYIKDASGETAYIYGVKTATGESQKFNTLGVEIGDVLKIYGQHTIYVDPNGAEVIEMKDAVYMSHTKGEDEEVSSILTLTFPDDNSAANKVNGYDDPWVAKTGDYSFDMVAFNNYEWNKWTYVRCGRKKESVASITTSQAIIEKVGSVIVTFDAIEKSDINSIKLYISSKEDFSSVAETVSVTPDLGNIGFEIKSPAENLYYKIEVDCKASSKNKNGFVQISKIVFVEAQ